MKDQNYMADCEHTMRNMLKHYYQSRWPNREFLPLEVKPVLLLTTFGGVVLSVGLLDTSGVLKLVVDIVLAIDDELINGGLINEIIDDEVIEGVIDEEQIDVDVAMAILVDEEQIDVDVAMAILVDAILETMETTDDEGGGGIVKGHSVKRIHMD